MLLISISLSAILLHFAKVISVYVNSYDYHGEFRFSQHNNDNDISKFMEFLKMYNQIREYDNLGSRKLMYGNPWRKRYWNRRNAPIEGINHNNCMTKLLENDEMEKNFSPSVESNSEEDISTQEEHVERIWPQKFPQQQTMSESSDNDCSKKNVRKLPKDINNEDIEENDGIVKNKVSTVSNPEATTITSIPFESENITNDSTEMNKKPLYKPKTECPSIRKFSRKMFDDQHIRNILRIKMGVTNSEQRLKSFLARLGESSEEETAKYVAIFFEKLVEPVFSNEYLTRTAKDKSDFALYFSKINKYLKKLLDKKHTTKYTKKLRKYSEKIISSFGISDTINTDLHKIIESFTTSMQSSIRDDNLGKFKRSFKKSLKDISEELDILLKNKLKLYKMKIEEYDKLKVECGCSLDNMQYLLDNIADQFESKYNQTKIDDSIDELSLELRSIKKNIADISSIFRSSSSLNGPNNVHEDENNNFIDELSIEADSVTANITPIDISFESDSSSTDEPKNSKEEDSSTELSQETESATENITLIDISFESDLSSTDKPKNTSEEEESSTELSQEAERRTQNSDDISSSSSTGKSRNITNKNRNLFLPIDVSHRWKIPVPKNITPLPKVSNGDTIFPKFSIGDIINYIPKVIKIFDSDRKYISERNSSSTEKNRVENISKLSRRGNTEWVTSTESILNVTTVKPIIFQKPSERINPNIIIKHKHYLNNIRHEDCYGLGSDFKTIKCPNITKNRISRVGQGVFVVIVPQFKIPLKFRRLMPRDENLKDNYCYMFRKVKKVSCTNIGSKVDIKNHATDDDKIEFAFEEEDMVDNEAKNDKNKVDVEIYSDDFTQKRLNIKVTEYVNGAGYITICYSLSSSSASTIQCMKDEETYFDISSKTVIVHPDSLPENTRNKFANIGQCLAFSVKEEIGCPTDYFPVKILNILEKGRLQTECRLAKNPVLTKTRGGYEFQPQNYNLQFQFPEITVFEETDDSFVNKNLTEVFGTSAIYYLDLYEKVECSKYDQLPIIFRSFCEEEKKKDDFLIVKEYSSDGEFKCFSINNFHQLDKVDCPSNVLYLPIIKNRQLLKLICPTASMGDREKLKKLLIKFKIIEEA